jgi:hypothetical protein
MGHQHGNGCNGGPFCDGSRPATSKDNRAYDAAVRARGGPRSPGGRAYIDEQARLFRQSQRNHRRQYHGGECCFRQLVKGKPRLAHRLAQRWIKMQVGLLAVPA